MRLATYIVALILTWGSVSGTAAQSAFPVQVDLDHAAFAYDQRQSLLEIYLAFGAKSLPFEKEDQRFRATLPVQVAVRRSTEATLEDTPSGPIWADSVALDFAVQDTSVLVEGQFFDHQVRVPVQPGEYEVQIVVPENEQVGRQALELRRDALVPDFSQEDLVSLSDITLATSIQPSQDKGSVFYKNGLTIHPNANQLYGQGLAQLYYYAESYNVDAIAGEDGTYEMYAYVAEANRPQPLPGLQRRADREARNPDVLVGSFDLSEVPSGSYFLRIALLNDENEAQVEQSRKFFVYNPQVEREEQVAVEASFEASQYANMPEEEVENALEHARVIANEQERRRAGNIQDLDEKRRFLMEFWRKRDPNTSTVVNEYKEEFYRSLQYANERYTTSYTEGWKTDRGRVLIKYGPPAQIEPHLYDQGYAPYEIWQYNNIPGEGQAIFVFADQEGFGEFRLLHSSVTGERKMPNWQNEVRQGF